MKVLLKIVALVAGVLALAKLAQIAVDVLYDKYGKKYITSDEVCD